MYRTLIKLAVIGALYLASIWITWQWAEARTEARAAEARAEAVAQAREEAEAKYAEALEQQRVRARAAAERMGKLRDQLREQTQRAERYAASDAGQQACFGEEGTRQWNEY